MVFKESLRNRPVAALAKDVLEHDLRGGGHDGGDELGGAHGLDDELDIGICIADAPNDRGVWRSAVVEVDIGSDATIELAVELS